MPAAAAPSSAKELADSPLIKRFDRQALSLKPATQIGHQPKLLPPKLSRITLLGEELREIVEMRFKGTAPQALCEVRLRIEVFKHGPRFRSLRPEKSRQNDILIMPNENR